MAEKLSGIRKAVKRAKELWPEKNEHVALAYHLGVTSQAIQNWETQGGVPSMRHAMRIFQLTGVPLVELAPPPIVHQPLKRAV